MVGIDYDALGKTFTKKEEATAEMNQIVGVTGPKVKMKGKPSADKSPKRRRARSKK